MADCQIELKDQNNPSNYDSPDNLTVSILNTPNNDFKCTNTSLRKIIQYMVLIFFFISTVYSIILSFYEISSTDSLKVTSSLLNKLVLGLTETQSDFGNINKGVLQQYIFGRGNFTLNNA